MKILKWVLIIFVGGIVLYFVGGFVALMIVFGSFDSSSYEELVSNYELKSNEINEVRSYVNANLPNDSKFEIEFESGSISRFYLVENNNYASILDIRDNGVNEEDILAKLNWDYTIVTTLRNKLDNANCISVKTGNPCQIGFQRSGMGMYFYNLYDEIIPDSLQASYSDSCRYVVYKDDVVMEWGGGAVGPQCFPDFRPKSNP